MNKFAKTICIIALVLLIIPLAFVIITNQAVVALPFDFIRMEDYPLIGAVIPTFLFWLSVGFLVLAVIGILVIIFYPKTTNTLELDTQDGSLTIQKKAIENFVLAIVKEEPFMSNPTVKVKMGRKRIDIKVLGQMRKVMGIPARQEELASEIKQQVTQLMGTNSNITTNVKLQNYKQPETRNDAPRVV